MVTVTCPRTDCGGTLVYSIVDEPDINYMGTELEERSCEADHPLTDKERDALEDEAIAQYTLDIYEALGDMYDLEARLDRLDP